MKEITLPSVVLYLSRVKIGNISQRHESPCPGAWGWGKGKVGTLALYGGSLVPKDTFMFSCHFYIMVLFFIVILYFQIVCHWFGW